MNRCVRCSQPFKKSGGGQKFCSRTCYYESITGEGHWNWQGGYMRPDCYQFVYLRVSGKNVLKHRWVMEQVLGRPLLSEEVVHHLNGTPWDNRPENLMLIASQAEHAALHSSVFRSDSHKECTRCHAIKPRSEFGRGSRRSAHADPHECECRLCRNSRRRDGDRRRHETPPKRYRGPYRPRDDHA